MEQWQDNPAQSPLEGAFTRHIPVVSIRVLIYKNKITLILSMLVTLTRHKRLLLHHTTCLYPSQPLRRLLPSSNTHSGPND